METALSGIVLAGGKSTRMGEDKAWMVYNGKPLIEHAINSVEDYCNEILISAKGNKYNQLPYAVYADQKEGLGPIGGIFSTVPHTLNEWVLVTACDIPLLEHDMISPLIKAIGSSDIAYLQLPSGRIQPLPFIIHKKLMPVVHAHIDLGNYKLQDLINACVQKEGINSVAYKIEEEPLNINRPEDLK